MNLVQLNVEPGRLLAFAKAQRALHPEERDLGYVCHAWLAALFGELAPQPFRLLDAQRGPAARLLGYTGADSDALREHARTFAPPDAWRAWQEAEGELPFHKPMPRQWRSGQRLGFDLLGCPISRRQGVEKDLFLRRTVDALPPGDASVSREAVYLEWLERVLTGPVTLERAAVQGYRRVRVARRDHGDHRLHILERPQVSFRGVARVVDGDAFARLLAHGVGRHRSFGYGMLLLSPP